VLKFHINGAQAVFTDNRTGTTHHGVEYAADIVMDLPYVH
jgi:hypothetical protein